MLAVLTITSGVTVDIAQVFGKVTRCWRLGSGTCTEPYAPVP